MTLTGRLMSEVATANDSKIDTQIDTQNSQKHHLVWIRGEINLGERSVIIINTPPTDTF